MVKLVHPVGLGKVRAGELGNWRKRNRKNIAPRSVIRGASLGQNTRTERGSA
jgi:hypothetical protein